MSDLRIAIIIGSTRPNRKSESVAKWILEQAEVREASYELVDLAEAMGWPDDAARARRVAADLATEGFLELVEDAYVLAD